MKKLIILITTALTLAGCAASSATAVPIENDTIQTQSVETLFTFTTSTPTITLDTKVASFMQEQRARVEGLNKNKKKIDKVIRQLKKRVNRTPYVFSGSTPYGWDCSGMVMWAYKELGVKLEHSATKQAYSGRRVKTPKVGDIVVFRYKGYTSFYHSAIYIGDGKIINANYGYGTTTIEPLSHYKGSKIVFRRFFDTPEENTGKL